MVRHDFTSDEKMKNFLIHLLLQFDQRVQNTNWEPVADER